MRRRRFRRFIRNENGSIIVETALMIAVLLLLVFGIVDMGRSLYVANTLILAARDGARTAVVRADDGVLIDSTKALVMRRFNTYRFGSDSLLASHITVTRVGGTPPSSIQVAIAYPFKWLTPVPRLMKWTTATTFTSTLHSQAEMKFEK